MINLQQQMYNDEQEQQQQQKNEDIDFISRILDGTEDDGTNNTSSNNNSTTMPTYTQPTMAPSSSSSSGKINNDNDNASSNNNNDNDTTSGLFPNTPEQKSRLGFIVLTAFTVIAIFGLWRCFLTWKRRRERHLLQLQSARADTVLGDMQMVPNDEYDDDDPELL